MKKFLTILALTAVFGMSVPAFAAPPPPPPSQPFHSNYYVHAGYHHSMMPPPRHHGYYRPYGSFSFYTGYPYRVMCPYCGSINCLTHRPFTGVGLHLSF